jgi:hypothetical protein
MGQLLDHRLRMWVCGAAFESKDLQEERAEMLEKRIK